MKVNKCPTCNAPIEIIDDLNKCQYCGILFDLSASLSNLLQKYLIWYKNYKDDSASIVNSYITGEFLIVKDYNSNILEEIRLNKVKSILSEKLNNENSTNKSLNITNKLIYIDDYIDSYNKNNKVKVSKSDCFINGDYFFLYDLEGNCVEKIETNLIDQSGLNEVSYLSSRCMEDLQ
tara:strand:+ start:139 stop:669 length:531 start_codon:yes stop_codon:yes gene_type:complete